MTKKFNGIPQFGLAIDFETSGYSLPNYASKHQGISFGAIIFDAKTLAPIEALYREIKFNPKYTWSSEAESIHGLSIDYLSKNGVTQEQAACDLAELVIRYMGTSEIMLLGHRVNFDKAFTIQLMDSVDMEFSYHPTMIDSCSIATVLMELSYSDEIFQTLGLPKRGQHNSLEDIMYTLESVKLMKDYFISGIAASL